MGKFLTWLRSLLNDPSSPLHLHGFLFIDWEMYHHVTSGQPYDLHVLYAAAVCFTAGGGIDLVPLVTKLMTSRSA